MSMTLEATERPEDLGLSSDGVAGLLDYIESWIDDDIAPGAAIGLARHGALLTRGFGRMAPEVNAPPLPLDTIFLTASVSKPVTCTAVAKLMETGDVLIDTPVMYFIPEFGVKGKDRIKVHHLLTHTSGLPDMIPENILYRKQHKPLKAFISRICELDLLFEPGTNISYQSTGIAILGEIVQRVTGISLSAFLRREIFLPAGMYDTSLGSGDIDLDRIPFIRLAGDMVDADWSWNNTYWREFGAPWGGMFSTVRDMNIFCQLFLHDGEYGGVRIFEPRTVEDMKANQTQRMPLIPGDTKKTQSWGLGWRLNQPPAFGNARPPSPEAFGHYGATGTMVWADPDTGLSCALFTTQPTLCDSEAFHRCTDMVVEALKT